MAGACTECRASCPPWSICTPCGHLKYAIEEMTRSVEALQSIQRGHDRPEHFNSIVECNGDTAFYTRCSRCAYLEREIGRHIEDLATLEALLRERRNSTPAPDGGQLVEQGVPALQATG